MEEILRWWFINKSASEKKGHRDQWQNKLHSLFIIIIILLRKDPWLNRCTVLKRVNKRKGDASDTSRERSRLEPETFRREESNKLEELNATIYFRKVVVINGHAVLKYDHRVFVYFFLSLSFSLSLSSNNNKNNNNNNNSNLTNTSVDL